MNDQRNQTGQVSNFQDGCQTNSRRYDSFTTGPVWSAIPSNSWASCSLSYGKSCYTRTMLWTVSARIM